MKFQKDNLVLYRSNPARVVSVGAKIEILLADGRKLSVRDKDISLLHPGPVLNFSELDQPLAGEIQEACAILDGSTTTLPELAELIYSAYTPASAWSVCKLMQDGLYFFGPPEAISIRSKDSYEKELQLRAGKTADKAAWHDFVERVRAGTITDDDKPRVVPLEDFCLGKTPGCRILKELDIEEKPEHAHALLLKLGIWDNLKNPYPTRLGFQAEINYPDLESILSEERLDLTHLESYAIDDEGNTDPDDALSLDGEILWVHVADVAAMVKPDTPLDLHARGVAANLYLPEKTVTMLPPGATEVLGLGIHETSPALSFGISLKPDGSIDTFKISPSVVRVKRITYAQAQENISEYPFNEMFKLTQRYHAFRKSRNAVFLSFPEVKIHIKDGRVVIAPLLEFSSREMVTDAMLLAGGAAAQFAVTRGLPFPFTAQPAPETQEHPADIAAMFAFRRLLKPSVVKTSPDLHAGLGLTSYSRVTSPLRRYLDLVAHQQIRASLSGGKLLDEQEIMNRIGTSAAMTGTLQKIERLSNLHWTLVYLMQNPQWRGKGIVAEIRERYAIVIIPELALETRITGTQVLALNQELLLGVTNVDLPGQTAHFVVD